MALGRGVRGLCELAQGGKLLIFMVIALTVLRAGEVAGIGRQGARRGKGRGAEGFGFAGAARGRAGLDPGRECGKPGPAGEAEPAARPFGIERAPAQHHREVEVEERGRIAAEPRMPRAREGFEPVERFGEPGDRAGPVGGDGKDTVSYMAQDDDKHLEGWGVDLDLGRGVARTGQGRKEQVLKFENAEGTSYGDGLIGSKAGNKLWGMDGNDDIWGMKGHDRLFGGNGNDRLYGGNGQDQLTGGRGTDHLWGGNHSDHFIFADADEMAKGSKRDVIEDFEQGDRIDLSGVASFDFIGGADFSAGGGAELRFKNELLQGDIDGDGKVDFEIKVKDMNTLHDSDFIL